MVKKEIVCPCPTGDLVLQVENLPYSQIPHQSRLFVEYQKNPLSLKKYYPLAVESHTQIPSRIPEILKRYKVDRQLLCDVLEEANRAHGASEKTLENIKLLRQEDCVAVVSGQQAGLFTGPLFTIYKALTAVKMSECLTARGIKSVPVFWIATEDHDFEEVSKIEFIDSNGKLSAVKNEPAGCHENLPVGYVKLDDSIEKTINDLFDSLPNNEFTGEIRKILEETWIAGSDYGDAFARLLTRFLRKFGLIVLCPLDPRLKKLASPIYVEAIRKSDEIVSALIKRSEELTNENYHAQVSVTENYFPLFWQAKDRTRHALKKSEGGTFKTKDIEREFTHKELAELASVEPQRFSPSVVLRSVVQDYLLPTVCYFAGAAEIAYFAQSSEVYRILDRPVTPIFHRQSFTIVETKYAKTLQKYDLKLRDFFNGIENLEPKIVEKFLNPGLARDFDQGVKNIELELDKLDKSLAELDPTLADSLTRRRPKIIYHLTNIRAKFHSAQIKKDEAVHRRIEAAFAALFPNKALQERSLNLVAFYSRYGNHFIDWIYQAIDLEDKDHRIVYF